MIQHFFNGINSFGHATGIWVLICMVSNISTLASMDKVSAAIVCFD